MKVPKIRNSKILMFQKTIDLRPCWMRTQRRKNQTFKTQRDANMATGTVFRLSNRRPSRHNLCWDHESSYLELLILSFYPGQIMILIDTKFQFHVSFQMKFLALSNELILSVRFIMKMMMKRYVVTVSKSFPISNRCTRCLWYIGLWCSRIPYYTKRVNSQRDH